MKCYWKMNFKVGMFAVHEQSFLGLCTIIVQDQVFFSSKKVDTLSLSIRISRKNPKLNKENILKEISFVHN